MKYLVTECHEGYAVLMDEASRFVFAANLRYEVGQTVTDPILMEEPKTHITRSTAVRITSAAACLLLLSAAGFRYYLQSWKTQSVVLMNSELQIEMELNSRGQVISLKSDTEDGKALLKEYNGKRKPQIDVVNDLVKLQKDKGILSDGDTVDFYITSDNENDYKIYKTELEQSIPKMQINVSVQDMDSYTQPAATTAPASPAQTEPAKETAPAAPHADPPAAPAGEPAGPLHGEGPAGHIAEPPAPPEHPDEPKDPAEPPAPHAEPDAPAAPPAADDPEPPAPPQPAEPAEPPQPGDAILQPAEPPAERHEPPAPPAEPTQHPEPDLHPEPKHPEPKLAHAAPQPDTLPAEEPQPAPDPQPLHAKA